MTPPKWFYTVIAACAVLLTLITVYAGLSPARERWQHLGSADDFTVFNSRTGDMCWYVNRQIGCLNFESGLLRFRPTVRLRLKESTASGVTGDEAEFQKWKDSTALMREFDSLVRDSLTRVRR